MNKPTVKLVPFLIIVLCTLSSCSIYQQEFDCSPPQGVPCTSVTDLERMIVETEKGPDLFLPFRKQANCSLCGGKIQEQPITPVCQTQRKVWVCDQSDEMPGNYIDQMTNSPCLSNSLGTSFCPEPYCTFINYCQPIEGQDMPTNDCIPTCTIFESQPKALQETDHQREGE